MRMELALFGAAGPEASLDWQEMRLDVAQDVWQTPASDNFFVNLLLSSADTGYLGHRPRLQVSPSNSSRRAR